MGTKLSEVSRLQLETTAEAFRNLAEQLQIVAAAMLEFRIDEMPLPWNQRQFDCLDVVVKAGIEVEKASKTYFLAKTQNRPSQQDKTIERRRRTNSKKAASGLTSRGPGRPRKSAT